MIKQKRINFRCLHSRKVNPQLQKEKGRKKVHKLISFFVVVNVWKLMCCRTILQIRESTLYFGNEALKKKKFSFHYCSSYTRCEWNQKRWSKNETIKKKSVYFSRVIVRWRIVAFLLFRSCVFLRFFFPLLISRCSRYLTKSPHFFLESDFDSLTGFPCLFFLFFFFNPLTSTVLIEIQPLSKQKSSWTKFVFFF